jgi:hypothetical protein
MMIAGRAVHAYHHRGLIFSPLASDRFPDGGNSASGRLRRYAVYNLQYIMTLMVALHLGF